MHEDVLAGLNLRHVLEAHALENAAEIHFPHQDLVIPPGFDNASGNA
jgi:hypothetical protein